jgi:FkbM family methyltransferase
MFKSFISPVRRAIQDRELSFVFVDVGARDGIVELRDIRSRTSAYGFEPNAEEFEKLVSVTAPDGGYRKLVYCPYAVGDFCGKGDLCITSSPQASGLLEPDLERLREIKWKGRVYPPNFGEHFFTVVRREPVEVRTLAWFAQEQNITHIDYLKIDVEGSEYDVLAGAGPFLKSVSVIKVEVCFIAFRKGQKLFSEVDLLLRSHGFDLLRYEIVPNQIGYKERTTPFSFGPSLGFPDPNGQPLQSDAVYVNRSLEDERLALAQAIVLIEKNYLDEALFILKRKVPGVDPTLLRLLSEYKGNARRRLVEAMLWSYRNLQLLAHPTRWRAKQ